MVFTEYLINTKYDSSYQGYNIKQDIILLEIIYLFPLLAHWHNLQGIDSALARGRMRKIGIL